MNIKYYPPHFKLPPETEGFDSKNFHLQWVENWDWILKDIKGKDNAVGIEVGSLHGCSAVWSLEHILNGKNTTLYCIDINESEYFKHNIEPYKNVKFLKGRSASILRTLIHDGLSENFANYIYIDGSHLAIDVLIDATLGFQLVKPNGFIIFDDYGWGIHTNDETQKPKLGIDCFLNGFQKYYEAIGVEWQVYLKKIPYQHSYLEAKANYELDGGKL